MKRTTTIIMALIITTLSSIAGSTVEHLRCEYLEAPLGIDVRTPRLSWELSADERGIRQDSYRILVASSVDLLNQNRGDVWDSGVVKSDQSSQVEYAGPALRSKTLYFWKVVVATSDGAKAESKPASWSMGLLEVADWQADWIGLDKKPDVKPAYRAALDGKARRL